MGKICFLKPFPILTEFCKRFIILVFFISAVPFLSHAQAAPAWVTNAERVYPGSEWIAVTAQGNSRPQAEAGAMNALARVFRTNIESITQASQQFSQIINNTAGSKNVSFEENSNFFLEVNTSTNVSGLIGVQIDVYTARNNTVHVCARMNRIECASRYSSLINENSKIINRLLAAAGASGTFETYARLNFAHSLAQVTDNFQNILEVLDPSAVNRKPSYGSANAIKVKMLECASLITIGIALDTEVSADKTLLTRAAGSFFKDLGFKTDERGTGDYVLRANVRFEDLSQNVFSCRYIFDASIYSRLGTSIFSFTENDRKSHRNSASEARRLAVQSVENSFKEENFAKEFNSWLNTMLE